MNERYRVWGVVVSVIYAILAIPIVVSNSYTIMFSYMGGGIPWGSYVMLGPSLILSVLVVIMSLLSICFPDISSFFKMEITLILMLLSLMIIFAFNSTYCVLALLYSLAGLLQIRKFWRSVVPEVPGKHLKRVTAFMLIPIAIACATIAFGVAKSTPKMPAEFKGIKFMRSSLRFYDYWSTKPSMGLLVEEQEVQGILFPKNTFLSFDESGKITQAQISEGGVAIQGVDCVYGQNVYFDKAGRMTGTVLPEDQVINGTLYRAGVYLKFNEDGSMETIEYSHDDH